MPEQRWFEPEELERDVAADDGPRDRGDRGGRPRGRQAPLRRDEARVADAARPDGRVDPRPHHLRAGQAGRRGRRRGVGGELRAGLEAPPRGDRVARPAPDRASAGGHLARALGLGRGRPPGLVHDHRGRREDHVHDEPVRVRPAPGAQGAVREERLRAHQGGARLVLRPQGLPPLLHPLLVHERVDADPVVRATRSIRRTRRRTTRRTRAPGTGTSDREDIPERHWKRYGATKPS